MRTKKVNRYWCDFCDRASLSAGWTRRHESRCTKNPARVCGLCEFLGLEQADTQSLIAILPDPAPLKRPQYDDQGRECYHLWDGLEEAVEAVMPKLREAANHCPACIMAAIRLRGIPAPEVASFKYQEEKKALMDAKNQRDYEEEIRREYHYG